MQIVSVLVKNEGLTQVFNHFFGDVVKSAYIAKRVDLDEFNSADEALIKRHNEDISQKFSSVSNFVEIDIGYLIVLTFSSGQSVEINLAEQSCPMSFTKFDLSDAVILKFLK